MVIPWPLNQKSGAWSGFTLSVGIKIKMKPAFT